MAEKIDHMESLKDDLIPVYPGWGEPGSFVIREDIPLKKEFFSNGVLDSLSVISFASGFIMVGVVLGKFI